MLHSILVPLDGSDISEQIIPVVERLATGLKASVTLIHVVDTTLPSTKIEADHRDQLQRIVEEEKGRARDYLLTIEARLREQGIATSSEVIAGYPAEMLVSHAHTQSMGLIAMSTHGRSGFGRWLVGSVADRVLRTSSIPVLFFHPKEEKASSGPRLRRILLPLDGSPLAEQSIPFAVLLAKAMDLTLVLVRVAPSYPFYFSDSYSLSGAELMVEAWEALEKEASDYLSRILNGLQQNDLILGSRVFRGDPATKIIDLAKEFEDNIVVMSTHGRSGLNRSILGSVADKVVRNSGSPVLLIRVS
ncbi:MAG: UspA domain protein [Dehalococcoidia bacterium]|nr:UspA domain protein [Dehalococcoidia bacterium]